MNNNVRGYRLLRGMTQEELGKMVGSGKSYICKLDKQTYEPTLKKALMISDALRVDVRDIFFLSNN